MSVRTDFQDELKRQLPNPRDFNIRGLSGITGAITKKTIIVLPPGFSRGPNVQGVMDADFIVRLVSTHDDPDKAEKELDGDILTVLQAISRSGALWTRSRFGVFDGNQWGHEINCSIPTNNPY